MALINCNECNREISDRASACPNCGAPIKQEPIPKSQHTLTNELNANTININLHAGGEVVYYSNNKGVKITNTRFIVESTTYPLQGITSIKTIVVPVSKMPGIVVAIIGVIIIVASKGNWGAILLGLIVTIAGILIVKGTDDKHAVQISTSAAETNALVSTDKEYIEQVARALNEAIIHRG